MIYEVLVVSLMVSVAYAARGEKSEHVDKVAVRKGIKALEKALDDDNEPMIASNIRELVRAVPEEDLKMVGIDLNAWTLRVGTATYVDGDIYDITLTPFWPSIRGYAHIIHNPGAKTSGIGYLRGETSATKKSAKASFFRRDKVPRSMTKLVAYGEGGMTVNGIEETPDPCRLLKHEWDDILEASDGADRQTFVVLTNNYYCPSYLRQKVGDNFRELNVQIGYASDGTEVDILVGSEFKGKKLTPDDDRHKPNVWFASNRGGEDVNSDL